MFTFTKCYENSKKSVRAWWLMLIVAIVLIVCGILAFIFPMQSYRGVAIAFGWLMLFTGIIEIVISSTSRHFITGRGWMMVGGIVEMALGFILVFDVALSEMALPVFLGFWLLLRGIRTIGLAGDLRAIEVGGTVWTMIGGILLTLCAIGMLIRPLTFGTVAVVVWVGVALLLAGLAALALSLQLRRAHLCFGSLEGFDRRERVTERRK